MFCSKCGRTLKSDWKKCMNCGMPIGKSRFEGIPYTSAQMQIAPGDAAAMADDSRAYTRTTYTGGDYSDASEGDIDVRTTYRPVYEASKVEINPREVEEADEAPEDAAEATAPVEIDIETLERNIEGFQISDIKSRPIVSSGRPGISPDVNQLVRKLNTQPEEQERRPRRGRHVAANDPYLDDESGAPPRDEQPDDEYYEDGPESAGRGRLIKIIVALAVVAALFVLGVYVIPGWVRGFKSEVSSPIEGVTYDLYNQGVALIESHTQKDYIDGVMAIYSAGGYPALSTRLNNDKADISALLPETPGNNDQLFVDALSAIQTDINSVIILDAVEIANNGAVDGAKSQERWANIGETLASFKAISTALDLQRVVNAERVEATYSVSTPEPISTPEPQYGTLQKGDDSDKVRYMQEKLAELGYLTDRPDGKFGPNTQTAVKLFEQENGLEVDGIADNTMLATLFSGNAKPAAGANVTPTPPPTEEPTTEPTSEPSTEPTGV